MVRTQHGIFLMGPLLLFFGRYPFTYKITQILPPHHRHHLTVGMQVSNQKYSDRCPVVDVNNVKADLIIMFGMIHWHIFNYPKSNQTYHRLSLVYLILGMIRPTNLIWRFPEIGLPINHPFEWYFLLETIHWGYHHLWKPPYIIFHRPISSPSNQSLAKDAVLDEASVSIGDPQ